MTEKEKVMRDSESEAEKKYTVGSLTHDAETSLVVAFVDSENKFPQNQFLGLEEERQQEIDQEYNFAWQCLDAVQRDHGDKELTLVEILNLMQEVDLHEEMNKKKASSGTSTSFDVGEEE